MAIKLEAATFQQCLGIKSRKDEKNELALKFVRVEEVVYIDTSDNEHRSIVGSMKADRNQVEDAGFAFIMTSSQIPLVNFDGSSDSIPFHPTEEQRRRTIELMTQALLGVAHVLQHKKY